MATNADEVLVHVLVAAGKPADALALGRGLAHRLDTMSVEAERRVELLVAIARAGLSAGELDAAADAVIAARDAAGADPDAALLVRVDTLAGEVALDRSELDDAERLTRRRSMEPAPPTSRRCCARRCLRSVESSVSRMLRRCAPASARPRPWPSTQVSLVGISAPSRSWRSRSGSNEARRR